MLDNQTEREFQKRLMIARVVEQIRKVQAMTPTERRAWRKQCRKERQQANEEFCKQFPEKCPDPETTRCCDSSRCKSTKLKSNQPKP